MHQTNKSDLMEYIESLIPPPEDVPNMDVKIVDVAALVHIPEEVPSYCQDIPGLFTTALDGTYVARRSSYRSCPGCLHR